MWWAAADVMAFWEDFPIDWTEAGTQASIQLPDADDESFSGDDEDDHEDLDDHNDGWRQANGYNSPSSGSDAEDAVSSPDDCDVRKTLPVSNIR